MAKRTGWTVKGEHEARQKAIDAAGNNRYAKIRAFLCFTIGPFTCPKIAEAIGDDSLGKVQAAVSSFTRRGELAIVGTQTKVNGRTERIYQRAPGFVAERREYRR